MHGLVLPWYPQFEGFECFEGNRLPEAFRTWLISSDLLHTLFPSVWYRSDVLLSQLLFFFLFKANVSIPIVSGNVKTRCRWVEVLHYISHVSHSHSYTWPTHCIWSLIHISMTKSVKTEESLNLLLMKNIILVKDHKVYVASLTIY